MNGSPPKLLGIEDAARATGLTPKALRRRIERGTLSSVRANGRRWIAMDELLRRGLLVPLDGRITPRQAPARLGAPEGGLSALTDRVDAIERRVAAQEVELVALRARFEIGATAARGAVPPQPPGPPAQAASH